MAETVTVTALGHRGDGIAKGPEGPVYVPFALPGETVLIERQGARGRLVEVIAPSPDRVAPVCPVFGRCGGCALQMLPLAGSRRLKRDFVLAALAQQGLETEVAETLGVPPESRRRAVLSALRTGPAVLLGYHERSTNRLVDIAVCPVLSPALAARIGDIRALVAPLAPMRKPVRVTVLLTRTGLDIDLEGVTHPSPRQTSELIRLAQDGGVARLSIAGEPVLTLAEPLVEVAGVMLTPPPGAFIQASAEAEALMAGLVVEHFAGAKRAADLFSGFGAFALALARTMPVKAVEASDVALSALAMAARHAPGLKRIETERRDLFAFPLAASELKGFDAVVFDPPRAGAKAQAEALAAAPITRIAAISCNPASFARDARILVDGGYHLERVVPVDQFVYSAEVEVVGLFRR
jgi:23S rRNA (uracil1939-C5)-methyltransferase